MWGGEPKKPLCAALTRRKEDPCDRAGGDSCGGEPRAASLGRRAGVLSAKLFGEPEGDGNTPLALTGEPAIEGPDRGVRANIGEADASERGGRPPGDAKSSAAALPLPEPLADMGESTERAAPRTKRGVVGSGDAAAALGDRGDRVGVGEAMLQRA